MAHDQQTAYVKGLVGNVYAAGRFARKAILELGSFDMNGSVRDLFSLPTKLSIPPSRYVGVDWRPGPKVDHVSLFHDIPWENEFDLLISCNAFEHDPYWKRSIEAGMRALKMGGEIILCAAGPGYLEHEVRSSPQESYYDNLDPDELEAHLAFCGAEGVMTVFTDPTDIGFHGHKRAAQDAG